MEVRKRTYNKPLLQCEAFVPNEYIATCNFVTYKIKCLVRGNEDSDGDGIDGDHQSWGCRNENKQIITFDSNGYLKLYELENDYFAGGACTLLSDPTNDQSIITLHKDNVKNGMTLYWKTSHPTDYGGWECIHQGTIDLSDDNRGTLS